MAIVQINGRDAQPLEALLARFFNILRVTSDRHVPILHGVGELGGQEDIVPLAGPLEPFANQVLVVHIDVGRVPESLAHLVRFVENFEAVLIRLRLAVKGRQTHSAEAEGGDLRTFTMPESALPVQARFEVQSISEEL